MKDRSVLAVRERIEAVGDPEPHRRRSAAGAA